MLMLSEKISWLFGPQFYKLTGEGGGGVRWGEEIAVPTSDRGEASGKITIES